ncbi:hypothetical protein B0H13DRAFT_1866339 [Mycena leptocephala]|nr:hypothetical protein B0H13DRAFT_1866339 [Mycena leptocephala]
MFSKISVIAVSVLFTWAVTASPLTPRFSTECCASFGSSNDPNVMALLGQLGVPIPNPPTFVGITCTPYDGTTPCPLTFARDVPNGDSGLGPSRLAQQHQNLDYFVALYSTLAL